MEVGLAASAMARLTKVAPGLWWAQAADESLADVVDDIVQDPSEKGSTPASSRPPSVAESEDADDACGPMATVVLMMTTGWFHRATLDEGCASFRPGLVPPCGTRSSVGRTLHLEEAQEAVALL